MGTSFCVVAGINAGTAAHAKLLYFDRLQSIWGVYYCLDDPMLSSVIQNY